MMVRSWYGSATVHHDIGLESPKQLAQIGYIVGIDLRSLHRVPADCSNGITLRFRSAGQHHVRKIGLAAIFCATTVPTPPAPIIRALHIKFILF